ncbi:hypothetical protein DFH06DRAFT_191999 [Mycena polygramma]|nr:hypothetical protein DFH06DRAFT_191999 [Mycena polygramma]
MVCLSVTALDFDIDDISLEALAKEWSRLENLTLCSTSKALYLPTLECMSFFAQYCPRLTFMHMTLDATAIPPCNICTVQRSLTSLIVEHSDISSSPGVARYLSGFFPNLSSIATEREPQQDGHRMWKEVEAQLPEFVRAREEEKFFRDR